MQDNLPAARSLGRSEGAAVAEGPASPSGPAPALAASFWEAFPHCAEPTHPSRCPAPPSWAPTCQDWEERKWPGPRGRAPARAGGKVTFSQVKVAYLEVTPGRLGSR